MHWQDCYRSELSRNRGLVATTEETEAVVSVNVSNFNMLLKTFELDLQPFHGKARFSRKDFKTINI